MGKFTTTKKPIFVTTLILKLSLSGKIFKSEEKQEVNDPDEIRPRLLNKKVIRNT